MPKHTKLLPLAPLLIISSFLVISVYKVNADNTPYNGTPYVIPGTIQAENFDNGGEGVAYHDSTVGSVLGGYRADDSVDMLNADGGVSVGWTTDGEWLKYTVNVTTAGVYAVSIRAATPNSGKSLGVDIDGANVATINIPNTTGFQSYQTINGSDVTLTSGTHVLKITMNTGSVDNPNLGFDINSITFTASNNPPPPPTNQPPVTSVGIDQSIILPANFVTLVGTATDPEKDSMTYLWTKVSGPTEGVITSPTSLTTTVTSLAQGTYIFWLTATDSGGLTNADSITVTVNPAVVSTNALPIAAAGKPQTIVLPINQATLVGSATDSDGQVVSYLWTQVAYAWSQTGSFPATIVSPSSATTNVTGLAQGKYIFRLTATDNDGGKATSDITITVSPAPINNVVNPVVNPTTPTPTNTVTPTPTINTYTNSNAAASSAAPSIIIPPTGIKKRSGIENIKNLQKFLNWNFGTKLAPLVVDGKWGYKTTLAIKLFQEANNLKVDGSFGKNSALKANELLGNGTY